ncbi:MAG TPA: hypothetical protein PK695_03955 [Chitinophagaceae bacterium]|nr:hypothetical protein [Chitinophagaceae bacterium]HMW66357.1 hypothetical protein [Chitinophagaceae bacterium]HNA18576.1 hypothetical protein [Chitinophagaceae bacterium]HNC38203.1 hypothetical protein [Chitinophagaceae bacterium]HND94563.1 hypothetical protein [Chitinophagaceae bacterium]
MYRNERNLTLYFTNLLSEEALQSILMIMEQPVQFCTAHELVNRNSITNNPKIIWRETRQPRLRMFRFLINKN